MISELQDQVARLNKELIETTHDKKNFEQEIKRLTINQERSAEEIRDLNNKLLEETKKVANLSANNKDLMNLKEKIVHLERENTTFKSEIEVIKNVRMIVGTVGSGNQCQT